MNIDIDEKIKAIQILDAQGQQVKMITKLEQKTIYIGDLSRGIYYLQISTTAEKTGVKKFIKVKTELSFF